MHSTTRSHRFAAPARLALAVGLLCCGACTTTRVGGNAGRPPSDSPWLQPSALLAEQIEDEATRLPWTHDLERVEQIRWFTSVGEPAYTKLLELAADPRDDVAAAAIAALGGTQDRRLVPFLRKINWTVPRSRELELERARAMVHLGDWSLVPTLISGLRDEKLYTRALCFQALNRATRQTLGYDPKLEGTAREDAVLKWEGWWRGRSGEGLLSEAAPAARAESAR